jgi:hypothetical protein
MKKFRCHFTTRLDRSTSSVARGSTLALSLVLVIGLTTFAAASGSLSARVVNPSASFSAGTLILESSTPGVYTRTGSGTTPVTCYSSGSVVSTNSANCVGDPLPYQSSPGYPQTLTTSSTIATSTLTSAGNLAGSALALVTSSCGVAQVTNLASSDTGLAMNQAFFNEPGPLGSTAVGMDGDDWIVTPSSITGPQSFTLIAWFNPSAHQGLIAGFSTAQLDQTAPTSLDRALWIDSSGNLVWGVDPGAKDVLISSSVPTTGTWHMAVAEIGSGGQKLYLDGSLAATTNAGVTSAYSGSGYWHIGQAAFDTGWPQTLNSSTQGFNGALANVAVIPSQLSSAQVTSLYTSSTQTTYQSTLTSLTPSQNWPLSDSGTTPYTTNVPFTSGTSASACAKVDVTVQETKAGVISCVYPAGAGSCPAPSSTYRLSSMSGSYVLSPPSLGGSVTVAVTMTQTSCFSSCAGGGSGGGYNVLPGWSFLLSKATWTASIAFPNAYSIIDRHTS